MDESALEGALANSGLARWMSFGVQPMPSRSRQRNCSICGVALAAMVFVSGCRCGGRQEPPRLAPPQHYREFDGLVRATWRGAVEDVQVIARDLTEGAPADVTGGEEAVAEVGGAVGYLQTVEVAEDVPLGLVRAAAGCGSCHGGQNVEPIEERLPWTHETGAEWAVWGLVWNEALMAPEGGDEIAVKLTATHNSAAMPQPDTGKARPVTPEVRVGLLLELCLSCHEVER
jgi:hypothetical protein